MSDPERYWDEIKEKWREMKSGVTISTTSGAWDVLELLARKHDQEFFDPQEVHHEAIKQLFMQKRSMFLPVFIEVMEDESYDWLTRVSALLSASMTRHERVKSALRELVDEEETLKRYVRELASAFYRQGDFEYLEKISSKDHIEGSKQAKWLLKALSWKVDKEWCPYLDEHGVCLKKATVNSCDRILGALSYPSQRQESDNVVRVPTNINWNMCPEITLSSWPARL